MSDEHTSLDDLMRSPFDLPEADSSDGQPRDWWPIVAGLAVGALAVLGGYLIASGDETVANEVPASTIIPATTAAPAPTVVVGDTPVDFPPGFVEVTDMVGIKPEFMIDAGDELVVAFASASRRGFEVAAGFDGGDWVLETSTGEELTASGIVTSIATPGGFSVQFAKEGTVVPQRIRLINRWEVDRREGRIEIPFTGTPFEITGQTIELGTGVALNVDRLSLTEFDGELEWSLAGAGERGGSVDVFIALGSETAPSAVYFPRGAGLGPFGGQMLDEAAPEGAVGLIGEDQPGTAQDAVLIDVMVTLVGTLPADAAFDLSDVPGLDL